MSDDKVVEFRIRRREPADDAPLKRLARAPRPEYSHPKFLIDEKQRTVQCGACGQWLDPVWCLMRFLEHDERIEARIAYLKSLEKDREEWQQRAIERKRRMDERRQLKAAAANCGACGGTGWAPASPAGVVRCDCRKRLGAARLV